MAEVKVQFVVTNVSQNGEWRGRVIYGWETYDAKDSKGNTFTGKRQWTIWLEFPSELVKGDLVEFVGKLGTKRGTYKKDENGPEIETVDHFLNEARYTVLQRAVPLPPKPVTELTQEPPF
jgi:hypothetical protein